jgi:AraC-like DNA-binding protein
MDCDALARFIWALEPPSAPRHPEAPAIVPVSSTAFIGDGVSLLLEKLSPRHANSSREPIVAVARFLRIRSTTLWRVARRRFGVGPAQLGRALRVREAIRLLAETDEQVAQIAYAVGYQNPGELNRVFRHYFRCTPRQFRRILTGG